MFLLELDTDTGLRVRKFWKCTRISVCVYKPVCACKRESKRVCVCFLWAPVNHIAAGATVEQCPDVTACVHEVAEHGQDRLDKHKQYYCYNVKMHFDLSQQKKQSSLIFTVCAFLFLSYHISVNILRLVFRTSRVCRHLFKWFIHLTH